jgi:large subunit ribosomal protein L22
MTPSSPRPAAPAPSGGDVAALPVKSFTASHVRARISPYKARPVANLVRGKNAHRALEILQYEPRRAASMLRKVIKSALANASNDLEVALGRLFVAEVRVDGGPPLTGGRRFRPGPMGRAMAMKKRTSHIVVRLEESPKGPDAAGTKAAGAAGGAATGGRKSRRKAPVAQAGAKPAAKEGT